VGVLWRRSTIAETLLVRGALYVAVMVAVYLDYSMTTHEPALQAAKWAFLPVLALAVAVSMRLSGSRRFEATPLDLLLIFGALALPNLPIIAGATSNIGLSAAKFVLLCYAVELITLLGYRLRTALLGVTAMFYVVIAAHALA
jgi:UDP-GlcNAc:undecaprenyl-phosphate/decaprenyl-phosphate GlcNAc-1-phosphate transferase